MDFQLTTISVGKVHSYLADYFTMASHRQSGAASLSLTRNTVVLFNSLYHSVRSHSRRLSGSRFNLSKLFHVHYKKLHTTASIL